MHKPFFPGGAGCGLGSARCSRAGARPTGGGFDRAGGNYAQAVSQPGKLRSSRFRYVLADKHTEDIPPSHCPVAGSVVPGSLADPACRYLSGVELLHVLRVRDFQLQSQPKTTMPTSGVAAQGERY
jgi:hypothetical protein